MTTITESSVILLNVHPKDPAQTLLSKFISLPYMPHTNNDKLGVLLTGLGELKEEFNDIESQIITCDKNFVSPNDSKRKNLYKQLSTVMINEMKEYNGKIKEEKIIIIKQEIDVILEIISKLPVHNVLENKKIKLNNNGEKLSKYQSFISSEIDSRNAEGLVIAGKNWAIFKKIYDAHKKEFPEQKITTEYLCRLIYFLRSDSSGITLLTTEDLIKMGINKIIRRAHKLYNAYLVRKNQPYKLNDISNHSCECECEWNGSDKNCKCGRYRVESNYNGFDWTTDVSLDMTYPIGRIICNK